MISAEALDRLDAITANLGLDPTLSTWQPRDAARGARALVLAWSINLAIAVADQHLTQRRQ